MFALAGAAFQVRIAGGGKGLSSQNPATMEKSYLPAGQVTKLIGNEVRNLQEEKLGQIKDLARDEYGKLSLLSHGGIVGMDNRLPLPLEALSYGSGRRDFALDVSRDRLAQGVGSWKAPGSG